MTLSQTAVLTKQIITISIITIVVGTVSFIGYKIWYAYYLAHLPPVEEKPDTKFGLLPALEFPESTVSSANFSYSIDTSTGNLPKIGIAAGFEKLIKVYYVTKTFATLLSAEKSQNLAEKFGINNPPQILSETKYLFKESDKTLNVNLDNGNFIYKKESTMSGQENIDDDNKLILDFEKNLQDLGVFKNDLGKPRIKIIPWKNEGTRQISLWPQEIDKKPIFTPQFDVSLINAIVYKSAANLQNYLSLNFNYYPIDTSTFATYPIKTADQALADLKQGKGVIIIEPQKPQVSITSSYLAYYLPENYSPYLQPIFVFEGPHFAAYVPAINGEFQTPAK